MVHAPNRHRGLGSDGVYCGELVARLFATEHFYGVRLVSLWCGIAGARDGSDDLSKNGDLG